jgi:hypothetical protein
MRLDQLDWDTMTKRQASCLRVHATRREQALAARFNETGNPIDEANWRIAAELEEDLLVFSIIGNLEPRSGEIDQGAGDVVMTAEPLAWRRLQRYGLRRGAYDGATSRRFCLFEDLGNGLESRSEFDSKAERDARAMARLATKGA